MIRILICVLLYISSSNGAIGATPLEVFRDTMNPFIGCHQLHSIEIHHFDESETCLKDQPLWGSGLVAMTDFDVSSFSFEKISAPGAHGPLVGRYHGTLIYPCFVGGHDCRMDAEFLYSSEDITGSVKYSFPE